jgi:predicted nucleic acid-binding protein
MTTYVLDSSAALRYLDDKPGADRFEEILSACAGRKADLAISAIQWGEIAGKVRKRFGERDQARILANLLPSEAVIVPASAERAVRAASLKVDRNLAYADGFALELAMESREHVLVTADYDFRSVGDIARIEFLPLK